MQRLFIILGIAFLALGFLWPLVSPWLGKLPGDIAIERDNFRFYFPVTTMLVLSALITLLLWLFRK